MTVFKFGGASVKDAESIKNMTQIIQKFQPGWVVVSAMAKTTNALESLLSLSRKGAEEAESQFMEIVSFHRAEAQKLQGTDEGPITQKLSPIFEEIQEVLNGVKQMDFPKAYDALVGKGEKLSTALIYGYWELIGLNSFLIDAKSLIRTTSHFRKARIIWKETIDQISVANHKHSGIKLTQGFIGGNRHGEMTTLGREGSDFSAAIIAYALDAEKLTIWKDTLGMMNADPKVFEDTIKLESISFSEAIELAYYGASIIHPKTIQPLHEKEIPLEVRSFLNPDKPGTFIQKGERLKPFVPCFIRKENQRLIHLNSRNLDFIVEDHLSEIYQYFHTFGAGVNLMQNSAVSTSFSVTDDKEIIPRLIEAIGKDYQVKYNEGLTLYTIRHYTPQNIEEYRKKGKIYLEQITRETYQVLVRE